MVRSWREAAQLVVDLVLADGGFVVVLAVHHDRPANKMQKVTKSRCAAVSKNLSLAVKRSIVENF